MTAVISDTAMSLLGACVGTDEAAREAFAIWQVSCDFERLSPDEFDLLPMLARRSTALAIGQDLSPRIAGFWRRSWWRNEQLVDRSRSALNALAAAGIPVLQTGRAALITAGLVDHGERTLDELTLLVHPRDAGRTLDVVADFGWQWQHRVPRDVALAYSSSVLVVNPDPWRIRVGWHARGEPGGDDDGVWQRSADGLPAPEDQLVLTALRPSLEPGRLTPSVADCALLLTRGRSDLDWSIVLRSATDQRRVREVGSILALASEVSGGAAPAEVLTDLTNRSPGLASWALARLRSTRHRRLRVLVDSVRFAALMGAGSDRRLLGHAMVSHDAASQAELFRRAIRRDSLRRTP